MASGSKKRRSSRSPSRAGKSKRARQLFASSSTQPRQVDASQRVSREKSVFRGEHDPCFPRKRDAASLPTNDDYTFRLKVISSSTDLDNDVFKKAVQGLVKICFPEGILEELGLTVLEQHMREDDAPEENVEKMTTIFRSEMVHRITWMLAEYLDRPAKVEAGVRSAVAASAKLHGDKLGDDILGDVMASLHALREKVPTDSTVRLSNSTLVDSAVEGLNDDEDTESHVSDDYTREPSPPRNKKKKAKKRDRSKGHERTKPHETIEDVGMEVDDLPAQPEPSVPTPPKALRTRKDNKVSATWRWDIDSADISSDDIAQCITKTSDLFAYHALPIARRQLGPNAAPKETRLEIQKILTEMPDDEYVKWVESFDKLCGGDPEMLSRPEDNVATHGRRVTAATPAPIDVRRRATKATTQTPGRYEQRGDGVEPVSVLSHTVVPVKREPNANPSITTGSIRPQAQEDSVASTTTALRHLPTEERDAGPQVSSTSLARGASGGNLQALQPRRDIVDTAPSGHRGQNVTQHQQLDDATPIVDLLWGEQVFGPEQKSSVVDRIMGNLNKRVSAQSVGNQALDGTTQIQTKQELKDALTGVRTRSFDHFKLRRRFEYLLMHWVISSLASFPELKGKAFIFASVLPYDTTVLDMYLDRRTSILPHNYRSIKTGIMKALERQGITKGPGQARLVGRLSNVLEALLRKNGLPDMAKRTLLEKTLRRVAFDHRDKLRELMFYPVVKAWERMSGLQW